MAHSPSADAPALDGDGAPRGEFALAGPSACGDRARLPLRGDLAHVRLAGRCFVPHYAMPMPHEITSLIWLRAAAKPDAAQLCRMTPGARFDVLDVASGWAWGQSGEDGLVGYLPMSALEPA